MWSFPSLIPQISRKSAPGLAFCWVIFWGGDLRWTALFGWWWWWCCGWHPGRIWWWKAPLLMGHQAFARSPSVLVTNNCFSCRLFVMSKPAATSLHHHHHHHHHHHQSYIWILCKISHHINERSSWERWRIYKSRIPYCKYPPDWH